MDRPTLVDADELIGWGGELGIVLLERSEDDWGTILRDAPAYQDGFAGW